MRLAILGAGPGGQAMAGAFKLAGHEVGLWFPGWTDTDHAKLRAVEAEGIILSGALQGVARPDLCTSAMHEAVAAADVILIATPAVGHRRIGKDLARLSTPGQVVLLAPGRTGGAFEMHHLLSGVEGGPPPVAETSTLPFTCRLRGPNEAFVAERKVDVGVASLPSELSVELASNMGPALSLSARDSVLQTSFENLGAIFHVVGVLLNAGLAERAGIAVYYRDAITPAVAQVMEGVDLERIRTAEAYGVTVPSSLELTNKRYRTRKRGLYQAIASNPAYAAIGGVATLQHRYLLDDLPMSVAPLVALARAAEVPAPLHEGLLALGSVLMSADYERTGRNLETMGLAGMTAEQIRHAANFEIE